VTPVAAPADAWVEAFRRAAAPRGPAWLADLRRAAVARFEEIGFPTVRDEDWRFTNVAPIARTAFAAPSRESVVGEVALDPFLLGVEGPARLVFVDGRLEPALSHTRGLTPGVLAGDLAGLLARDPEKVRAVLDRPERFRRHAFAALNAALFEDGAVVAVPSHLVVEGPIHVLYLSTGGERPTASHPRTVVLLGPGSQATLVETYAGLCIGSYLTNAVTEVVLGANASLTHARLQRESPRAFHVGILRAFHDRHSRLATTSVSLGGGLVRQEVEVNLDAEGSECTLNGLYHVDGHRHVDNHTVVEHRAPHAQSRELYKGILDDQGSGAFGGRVVVHKGAQKTDARQANHNLLLSDEAVIDTKPTLEINADDVKCTHGATIGRLDDTMLFYLRSRGLSEDAARSLLIHAFASEVLERLQVEPARARLDALLSDLLHEAPEERPQA
jgi:Fe-S cluster assembly protein SufD